MRLLRLATRVTSARISSIMLPNVSRWTEANHTNLVAILLAEEGDSAKLLSLLDRSIAVLIHEFFEIDAISSLVFIVSVLVVSIGASLVIPALLMGGCLPVISLWGITILLLLIAISTISFALYNKLLSCNPVGKVAIYNSLIPVVGAITSCLCLGETFYWKYLIAGALATAGIYIINKGKK